MYMEHNQRSDERRRKHEKRIPQNMRSQEDKLAYWYTVAQREIAHMELAFSEVA